MSEWVEVIYKKWVNLIGLTRMSMGYILCLFFIYFFIAEFIDVLSEFLLVWV